MIVVICIGPQLLLCVCDCTYMITESHVKVIVFSRYGSDYQAVSKIMLYHNTMTVYSGHTRTHTHTHAVLCEFLTLGACARVTVVCLCVCVCVCVSVTTLAATYLVYILKHSTFKLLTAFSSNVLCGFH